MTASAVQQDDLYLRTKDKWFTVVVWCGLSTTAYHCPPWKTGHWSDNACRGNDAVEVYVANEAHEPYPPGPHKMRVRRKVSDGGG